VVGGLLCAARDVAFAYPGDVRALDGVDVGFGAGVFAAVLGPNGAGKSTLLRVLAGLLPAQRGSVTLGGEPVRRLSSRERARRVAVVPQGLAALPEVTVTDFVAGGRYAHRGAFGRVGPGDRDAVRRALAEADVEDLAGRALTELSGGQRQRTLVARALAQESELLLVDEPTSALDPAHQVATMNLLAALTCGGRGVVVVTHDLNLASQYATRVVLLDAGRTVADGPVEAVLVEDVLGPIYGPSLRYETWSVAGGGTRPIVLPWRGDGGDAP
jgi:iron complex transport system ATP-binding protein